MTIFDAIRPSLRLLKMDGERNLQKFYRVLQVLSEGLVNDVFRNWVVTAFYGAVVSSILLSFTLIRKRFAIHAIIFSLFLLIDLVIIISSFLIIHFVQGIKKHSEGYYKAFQCDPLRGSKEHSAFYTSCRPIVVMVGGMFSIAERDFSLKVYGNVIFQNTINLLLTFRG